MKKQKIIITPPDTVNKLLTKAVNGCKEDAEIKYFWEEVLRKEKEISEKKTLQTEGVAMEIKTIEQARELGLYAHSYKNGDWLYQDTDGYWHLFINSKELLPEVKKLSTQLYPNGDWKYLDTNYEWQIIKIDNIIKELEKKLEIANSIIGKSLEYFEENCDRLKVIETNFKYHKEITESEYDENNEDHRKVEDFFVDTSITISETKYWIIDSSFNECDWEELDCLHSYQYTHKYDDGYCMELTKEQYDYIKELKENED